MPALSGVFIRWVAQWVGAENNTHRCCNRGYGVEKQFRPRRCPEHWHEGHATGNAEIFPGVLVEQAYALDQDFFNCEEKNQFTEWKNRLPEMNNAYSCRAVLSSMVLGHIRRYFPEVLERRSATRMALIKFLLVF